MGESKSTSLDYKSLSRILGTDHDSNSVTVTVFHQNLHRGRIRGSKVVSSGCIFTYMNDTFKSMFLRDPGIKLP